MEHFKRKKSDPGPPSTLTSQDMADAEALWIACAQKALTPQKDFDILRRQLGLFLDDNGLWRCGGRLQNADIPFATKHPVLLPRKHPFTTLVVLESHQRVKHNGVKDTLMDVRKKYWILKGRSFVRALIHGCTTCKRYEGTLL